MLQQIHDWFLTRAWLGISLGALVSCGEPAEEITATARAAIFGGDASGPEDNAVIRVVGMGTKYSHNCTGTLVAPNVVVTARHCVSEYVDGSFTCDSAGNLTSSETESAGVMGLPLDPSKVTIHAEDTTTIAMAKKIVPGETATACVNDIAFVVLDRSLDDRPFLPMRLTSGVRLGEKMRVVGFGTFGLPPDAGRQTRSDLTVLNVGASEYWTQVSLIPPHSFTLGPGPCEGDSGGPALSTENAVVGVYSSGYGACDSNSRLNYYVQVAVFRDNKVRDAFKAAGTEPWIEGRPEPGWGGDGGEGGAPAGGSGDVSGTGGAADDAGVGGTSDDTAGAPAYRGPRKKGGCTCDLAGTTTSGFELLALCPLLVLCRRRTRRSAA